MKKLLFSLSIAALAATGANAQRIINNPDNKPFWGIRASLDISNPTELKYDDFKFDAFDKGVGFSVGAVYNIPIVANLYFEPGVSLFYNTWKWTDIEDFIGELPSNFKTKHNSLRQTGIRIPLNLGYHFDFTKDFKISVFTGPQLEAGFSCDSYVTVEAKAGNFSKEIHVAPSCYKDYDDEGPALNRFQAYWNIGVGFTYQKFYLGVTGQLGMTDFVHNEKGEDVKSHINRCSIALGYNF